MSKKKTVLVVDDEVGPRETLRMILAPLYEVHTASDGQEALSLLANKNIDLVTTCLKMPGLSGIDLLKEIKKLLPNMEVIIISGYATPANVEEAIRFGARALFSKPFNVQEIISGVGKILQAQELKTKGQILFNAKRYTEAIPLLKSATEAFAKDEQLWRELVAAASSSEQYEEAVKFAKQAIRQHPRSGWLWLQLGNDLTAVDRLEEAERAFNNARNFLNDKSEWLWDFFWRNLAILHRKKKDLEKEIEALENLHALGKANARDLNQLGIAHYNHQGFEKAVEFYGLSAAAESDEAPYAFFNMGLVFNDPELSQDADAADAYRRALALKPDYGPAKERLDASKSKLVPLAKRAGVLASGLVESDEHFQFYISPFEALQIDEVESIEELDPKTIQRAKKRLFQEIDLNDGKVGWLGDYLFDRSRALAVADELDNETKSRYHWAVFENKRLLRFLTRGDIEHFLYSDDYFPQETLELLHKEPEFRAFLSEPFSRQYNLLLTRSIERRLMPVVEALFDGRRWVKPEDDDVCFAGANKRVGDLVELMRQKATEGQSRKLSLKEMEEFLEKYGFQQLFNLLPPAFRSAQEALVQEVRLIALTCYKPHGDIDLAKGIFNLCKRFQFKNAELTQKLAEDSKSIEREIAEERKYECRLQFGSERPFQITKEGIRDGAKFFPASSVKDLRWGITVTGYTGAENYEYVFAVRNDTGESIAASWKMHKSTEKEQWEYFSSMVKAATNYLASAALEKIQKQLLSGQHVAIGPCTLTRQGVAFQTQGLIFKKNHFVAWPDVKTDPLNGQIVIANSAQSGISVAISMRDTENAVLLPILSDRMKR